MTTEPSPARHHGPAAEPTECELYINGPVRGDAVPQWQGWSARLLLLCQGEPDERDAQRWIYRLPNHCSEQQSAITVVFAKDHVVSTTVETHHTGEICAREF